MPRPLRIALVVLGTLIALPLIGWLALVAIGQTPSGLRVGGEVLPSSVSPEAELRRRARQWLREEVRVDADGTIRTRRREELGASIDVDAAVRAATRLGRTGDPFTDIPAWIGAWSGETDIEWAVRVDEAPARALIEELAHEVDRPATPTLVDGRGRLLELRRDGARLEREAAVRAVLRGLRRGRRAVRLPVTMIAAEEGDAGRPQIHPEARPEVLARYTTEYATRGGEASRAHNVELATSRLDGATIPPHGELSFNAKVGARGRAEGYQLAHVILDGEMVDGLGGGVCQVASTLHAAAFLAGLDVVEHTPHSRPSAYIPMGLDATVVWPSVDLVIANPFSFPIRVRASARDGRMIVELVGARRVRTVDWRREVLSTQPYGDRYVEDVAVPPGEERVSQRGVRGYVVLRTRTIVDASGVHLEEARLRYPPTDRIVRVAPGTLDPLTNAPREEPSLANTLPTNPYQ